MYNCVVLLAAHLDVFDLHRILWIPERKMQTAQTADRISTDSWHHTYWDRDSP